jgi:magnesium-transporting ATPase (P-type)
MTTRIRQCGSPLSVNATGVRDGADREIPLSQLVPGDVIHLAMPVAELQTVFDMERTGAADESNWF